MRTGDTGLPIVAMVCSTGGLAALIEIIAELPPDFPAAVIVLQHHDPQAPDRLAEILQLTSTLPVATARDGDQLSAGRVFVAPAGHHTLVTVHRTIALVISGERPPYRPSADLLLTSLAVAVQTRAVAVVLSGYGNDGATGATAIHRMGGLVVASDQSTSSVFSMPNATISRDRIIDHVVPVGDIAVLLAELLRGPEPGLSALPGSAGGLSR
jgi:two-component system chemotaxis response regulator CheB